MAKSSLDRSALTPVATRRGGGMSRAGRSMISVVENNYILVQLQCSIICIRTNGSQYLQVSKEIIHVGRKY